EDVLGIRVSGAYWSEDGYYKNSVSGSDLGGEQGWGTAVTALFTPTDEVQIKWRTEYSDSKYDQRPGVRLGGGFDGHNLKFYPYPIAPELIQGTSNTTTRLADFGQYCPDELKDPSKGPGICQNSNFGNADGIVPTMSEDPVTGKDYRGTDTQLLRTTLNASMDYDFGSFSSITGFTDYEAFDELDQDYQAVGRPDTLKAAQQGRSDLETKQFSQEFRFASSFEGPVQTTFGVLYWKEERKQTELNFIIACIENGKIPGSNEVWPGAAVAGICDGTNNTISSWQEQALQQFPCLYDAAGVPIPDPETGTCRQGPRMGSPWNADTEHKSIYFMLAWDLTDTWTIEFEDRFVWEEFNLLRQNFSSCSNLFFPFGTTAFVPGFKEGPVTDASQDIVCISEQVMNPNLPSPPPDANGNDWFLLQGAEKSSYNTPKLTARWQATDDMQTYFSWGIGQKPGGINTLSAGGTATNIDDERFDSEKVTAWEVGMKSEWEMAGFLRFNGAFFLNDYTDKQIGTQIVQDQGGDVALQPRIINAAGAQVWGTELEAIWQPSFVDGLVLSANYTYLKAEFTDFEDDTRSLIRAAQSGQCEIVYKNTDDEVVPFDPNETLTSFCRLNMKGHRLERTPEHAFVGNLQYTQNLMDTGFDYFVELTGTYQGDRKLDADNAVGFDSYWLVDTRLGLTQDSWEFLVYVNNLFDDDTFQTGGHGPDFSKQVTQLGFTAGFGVSHYFGVLPDPRTFGAMLTMRF
ncbi:MAG: TonB-dependent receptor, partial [Gammaproteobacteria bacterium]|nr:TonB-dependent receptor [Gammaproteobacteria bacterium]